MKALKYTLTLFLGLGMLGFSARLQAQATRQDNDVRPPAYIEDLLAKQAYAKAVTEFEKYIGSAQGTACDLCYQSFMFYNRLLGEDTTKTGFYQEKVDFYINQYLQSCGNTVNAYVLRANRMDPQDFDSTVVWMTKAIALDAAYADLYLMRGYALWQLQRTKEACDDFKKAKEIDEFYGDYYDTNCVEPEDAAEEATATPAE